MAIDEDLAQRMRGVLAERTDVGEVREMRMFGGLAFLVGGHMAVCASGSDGAMVRVEPAATADLVATTAAEPMLMSGRELTGWVCVATADLEDDDLRAWVDRGVTRVKGLPAKP